MNMIQVAEVTKRYKQNTALNHFSLNINEGEIYGLLGPNGAGKTTLINCITGLVKMDEGNILINNIDFSKHPIAAKKQIGVVPQDIAVIPELSAYENCKFMGELYGLRGKELKDRVKEAFDFVNLWDRRKEKPGNFSGGMKRRLNIAMAIVNRPKILIMDEPTVGVDPQSRNYILESVQTLNNEGMTIIYTSHYMEEVQKISSRVGIVDLGQLVAEGTVEELIDQVHSEDIIKISIHHLEDEKVLEGLKEIKGIRDYHLEDANNITVFSQKGSENLQRIIELLNQFGIRFETINVVQPTLEHVFLTLTGKKLRD
ncbi:ABC transporter ATP-binding protein [Niallia sp. Krafla_26]|uniref:ABC transporter ATP-binding protein n=1 Tax=Niallia sp. Krafla_26 TaxID=3064703 RepID=UPI003D17A4E3